jgi:hypothetical protein
LVGSARGGHVPDDHRDRLLVDLAAQLLEHRAGQLDPGDLDPALGQRYGHAPGPDRELQRPTALGQLGQPVDRGSQHLGGEHPDAGSVVPPRRFRVPDVLLPHAAHHADRAPRRPLICRPPTSR